VCKRQLALVQRCMTTAIRASQRGVDCTSMGERSLVNELQQQEKQGQYATSLPYRVMQRLRKESALSVQPVRTKGDERKSSSAVWVLGVLLRKKIPKWPPGLPKGRKDQVKVGKSDGKKSEVCVKK
jgi:hypothetical protein